MAKTSVASQGQIWYVYPEVDDDARTNKMKKIRPWIIVSPDIINFTSSGYIGFPITHSYNPNDKFKIEIDCPTKPGRAFSKSWVITYKPRTIDETDLTGYLGVANQEVVQLCIDRLYDYLKGNMPEYVSHNQDDEDDDFMQYLPEDILIEPKSIMIPDNVYGVSTTLLNNIVEEDIVEEKTISPLERDYRIFNPKSCYIDKYIDIESADEVNGYIKLYGSDKKQFLRRFKISSKSSKKFKLELIRYYNFLIDRKIEEVTTGT